jgi:hypothetical protein
MDYGSTSCRREQLSLFDQQRSATDECGQHRRRRRSRRQARTSLDAYAEAVPRLSQRARDVLSDIRAAGSRGRREAAG